mgnify:CR=1 FL=1
MNLRFCMQDMGGISLLQSLVKLNLLPIVIIEKPFQVDRLFRFQNGEHFPTVESKTAVSVIISLPYTVEE